MKKLAFVLALLPALALAAPQSGNGRAPAGPPGGPDDMAQVQRVQKRIRLAATLGLAEVLDLDDQGTLRVRDIIARNGEKRVQLQRQFRDNLSVVRDAARGDQAAMGQVDAALGKLREARAQMMNLDNELLQQLTQGLSPDKKAKAALFLARFRERARHMAMMGGPGWGHHHGGPGPGFGPRRGFEDQPMGPGRGRGGMMGPMGAGLERHAMMDTGEVDLEDWDGGE